jgi:predicted dehydrogenase
VMACDLEDKRLEAAKQEHPNVQYTKSYDEMLSNPDIDIIAIYTPDPLHVEHVMKAFNAGKNVIITKPIVNSLQDAIKLWKLYKTLEHKPQLIVGQSTRFYEPFKRQRSAFEKGDIGNLEFIDAHYVHRMDWFYDKSPWSRGPDAIVDWASMAMSHPVDLIRWYLGEIEEVHAYGSRSAVAKKYECPSNDLYTVNLRAADGRIARVMGNYGITELPTARNHIECLLMGDAGTSLAQYEDMRYLYTGPNGAEIKEDYLYHHRGYYYNNETHGTHYGEFGNYTQYFVDCIKKGEQASPSLREGLETFCVMEAIKLSVKEKRPVKVADVIAQLDA